MDTTNLKGYRRGANKGKARNVYFYPAHVQMVMRHAARLGLQGDAAFSSAMRSVLDQWAAVVEPKLVEQESADQPAEQEG